MARSTQVKATARGIPPPSVFLTWWTLSLLLGACGGAEQLGGDGGGADGAESVADGGSASDGADPRGSDGGSDHDAGDYDAGVDDAGEADAGMDAGGNLVVPFPDPMPECERVGRFEFYPCGDENWLWSYPRWNGEILYYCFRGPEDGPYYPTGSEPEVDFWWFHRAFYTSVVWNSSLEDEYDIPLDPDAAGNMWELLLSGATYIFTDWLCEDWYNPTPETCTYWDGSYPLGDAHKPEDGIWEMFGDEEDKWYRMLGASRGWFLAKCPSHEQPSATGRAPWESGMAGFVLVRGVHQRWWINMYEVLCPSDP